MEERKKRGGLGGGESEGDTGTRLAGGVYEISWPLAKVPGSASPGENYSRYEFTVGAGP